MSTNETIVSFSGVDFEYSRDREILQEANFNIRRGSKLTIMGQNGAGKSTIFKLINGDLKPRIGKVNILGGLTIATAFQVMPPEDRGLTVRAFFRKYYQTEDYNVDAKINAALATVHLNAPLDRTVKSFSGGQQARLLVAAALIQEPDLLLLDEPTNNLDADGIEHLTDFLIEYKKTAIVISHDADFLNAFTDGVLYLDIYTHKLEQYVGNYFDVVDQISARIERENRKNTLLAKEAQESKDQANTFANKGGKLRAVAKKLREKAEELESMQVDVRREDKPIRAFEIAYQEGAGGEILKLTSVGIIRNHEMTEQEVDVTLRRDTHLLLSGPNGIGKTTLLESIANGTAKGMTLKEWITVGYYRQDFSNLDFDKTVYDTLREVVPGMTEQELRSRASGFLITGEVMKSQVGSLSEWQKALVAFCRIMFMEPGLLILDEPTNHVNFRHIPVIAEALDKYEGAMILVSHVQDFVWQIRIDEYLDLE